MRKFYKYIPVILLSLSAAGFFHPFFINNKLPVPADAIVGLYHPFRDLYADEFPNGLPYKNSLITDPVRQQFPWKYIATDFVKHSTLPLWNPYNFAGTPLIANFQTGFYYPLNILFMMPDFAYMWGLFIFLQPLLASVFMYLYLRNLTLNYWGSLLGGFVFAFSGFMVSWMEWGNIGHTILWIPLILLGIDKAFLGYRVNSKLKNQNAKLKLKIQKFAWSLLIMFSLISAFFAGHLQIFVYLYLISIIYFFAGWIINERKSIILIIFLILNTLFLILTSVQWVPTLQFIQQSGRDIDQSYQIAEGWFLPAQHLAQFIAPDFFGNPATLNYWGVWNYGEFVGYIGIFPLILAIYAMFFRFDRKTMFFGTIFFSAVIFALPTWLGQLPFVLHIPFFSTAQPSRLIFLAVFALAVLSALGLDSFAKSNKNKKVVFPLIFISIALGSLWLIANNSQSITDSEFIENISIARSNLILPTIIFLLTAVLITIYIPARKKIIKNVIIAVLLLLTVFDLFRFAYKFLPFTDREYLYPETNSIYFARKFAGLNRVMAVDDRILPPNFSIMYYTMTVDGYDPLYLRRYAELIAASERGKPDISPPFGFNRIITPKNYDSRIIDLLGVKYVFGLDELESEKLVKVLTEGQTKVFENLDVYNRAFFVKRVISAKNKQDAINKMFDRDIELRESAIVEGWDRELEVFGIKGAKVEIGEYKSNRVVINTNNQRSGFLVLTDSYYPAWKAFVCDRNGDKCREAKIYITDYNFRGVVVPAGRNSVVFEMGLF